jgi:chloramphenicol-sensitive protein RarD
LFHEPMPPARLAGFALVWIALIIFTVDGLRGARRGRVEKAGIERTAADPTAATVEPATALPPH